MENSGENYTGLIAELYDLVVADNYPTRDRDYYRSQITREPGPVLDATCGTGRLLLDYLRDGLDVEGVDASAEMLAACRVKAAREGLLPTLHEQYLQRLDLPRRFRTILIPAGSFQLIAERVDAMEALRRVRSHLEPGGRLPMSCFIPWEAMGDAPQRCWKIGRTATRPSDGVTVLSQSADFHDRIEQMTTTWHRYDVFQGGGLHQSEIQMLKLRWYFKQEIRLMLEAAGFDQILIHGDYTDEYYKDGHSSMTIIARTAPPFAP